jgi:hypothetical protein
LHRTSFFPLQPPYPLPPRPLPGLHLLLVPFFFLL